MNKSEFENSLSVNWTFNTTFSDQSEIVYNFRSESIVIHATIAVLTVFLNILMIICLQKNKSKISEVIYKQLLSLCVSDTLAGISSAGFCLTLIDSVNRSSKACAFIMTSFPGAQNAVLLNLCILSLRRWVILMKADVQMVRSEPRLLWVILITLCPWIVSFLFANISTFVGMTDSARINGCLSPALIKDPTGLIAVSALQIITLLMLNTFYICSVIKLKRLTRQTTGANQISHSVHQQAYFHLFAVLMITNVTTIPSILVTFFANPESTETTVMNFIPHLQALNSLINPILYSAHIGQSRASIKDNLLTCFRRKSDASPSSVTE